MKPIISLTSDFGLSDHYVGSMKGVILGINPDSQIVDITHEIPKYDIFRAAFAVKNFYKYFPKDSIHVVVVDPGVGSVRKPIAAHTEHGVFVGPDNGVFSFVLKESKSVKVFEIINTEFMLKDLSSTFHGRDIFAPAAAHLSLGVDIQELGKVHKNPISLNIKKPELKGDEIVGEVIYTDSFGNLITNIPGVIIKSYSKICIDKFIIDTIVNSYDDREKGKLLAIIGSSGFLEISVNQGSAADIIKDQKVTIKK